MATSETDSRLRPPDLAALRESGVLAAPCLAVEQDGGRVRVCGTARWSAPVQRSGVGRAEWHWDGRRLEAHTDRYGFRPLFYRELPHGIAVSPSLVRLLAIGGSPGIDDDALGVFVRLGFFIGEDTPFRGIRVMPPGGRLDWQPGSLRVEGSYACHELRAMDRTAALDAYIDVFGAAVARAAGDGGPHVVPLSGGRDSRHILFALARAGATPIRCLTLRNYPPRGSRDVQIASRLARELGLPHEIVEEAPSRVGVELRKNLITHFCADEHAWFLPLAVELEGSGVRLWDGIGGDVLSNGHRLDATRLALARAGRAEDLALAMADEALLRAIPLPAAARLGRDAAVARLTAEIRRHLDAPNPVGSFFFWNRTRREIALVPFGLWDGVGAVVTPYLDPAVFDLLTALPAEMFLDRQFHADAIRRAFPEYAHLPFDVDSALPVVRAPERSPADAPYYRRLFRETGAYVWGAPAGRYVRRTWLASRAAHWTLRRDYSDAALMPLALYLAQLETMSRWDGEAALPVLARAGAAGA